MEQKINWLGRAHAHLLSTNGERWRFTRHGARWTFSGYLMEPASALPWIGCNATTDVHVGDVLTRLGQGTVFVVVEIERVPSVPPAAYLRLRCIPARVPIRQGEATS
jgi:hypothetical protein